MTRKGNKGIQNRKKVVKLSLFTDGIIIHVENLKKKKKRKNLPSKKHNSRSNNRVQHGHIIQEKYAKSIEFLYTSNEHMGTEIKNIIKVIIIQYHYKLMYLGAIYEQDFSDENCIALKEIKEVE